MPGSSLQPYGEQYSSVTGFIYVFNLIVGTGCLTLPDAFELSGWILSSGVILLLAAISFITATWVVESMACANAVNHWRSMKQLKKRGQVADELVNRTIGNAEAEGRSSAGVSDTSEDQEDQEEVSLITEVIVERTVGEYYAIQERIEMGEMAKLFFVKVWVKLFYVFLCVYLYGDLAIYEAAVSKSLMDITCTYTHKNCSIPLEDSNPCFRDTKYSMYSRLDVYRMYICIFIGVMGPFVFFNLTKTKYMQILTTITRWLAMILMIVWAITIITEGNGAGHPPLANFKNLPELFGVCVYSFMCHHSLPSLLTPISNKKCLFQMLASDYLLILLFYYLLAYTGIFAFGQLNDLYTLNFQPDSCKPHKLNLIYFLQVFLLLFPVFTLSTNFPIIAITLRNNLKGLFLRENRRYAFFTNSCLFPLLACIPPTLIGLITSNVQLLVGITGAYAGSVIQYIVPVALVYCARRKTLQRIGMGVRNPHASPLQHNAWLYLILIWAFVCLILVTIYLYKQYTS